MQPGTTVRGSYNCNKAMEIDEECKEDQSK